MEVPFTNLAIKQYSMINYTYVLIHIIIVL